MIRIGIIGTGGMARVHAEEFSKIANCEVVAACDLNASRLASFVEAHNIPYAFGSVEALLSSGQVDAVSIVTPDPFHKKLSIQALEAGMHVLCEKPLALNASDAKEMADAAKKAKCINMVNLSYRNAHSLQKARELIAMGRIGNIRHVEASYLQSWLVSPKWGDWKTEDTWLWRLSSAHGSKGVLGDVGVHILDFVRFPVGDFASVNCTLTTFDKAENNQIGEYHLDANDSALITARMNNGAMASIQASRWATGHLNDLRLVIHGDKGAVKVSLQLDQEWDRLEVCLDDDVIDCVWKELKCDHTPNIYQRFIQSILSGVQDQPDFEAGLQVQRVLDACEQSDQSGQTVLL